MRAAALALLFAALDAARFSAGCAAPASSPNGVDLAAVDAAPADLTSVSDLGGPVCGNGDCEPGESGAGCGSDCCDAMTSCDASRGNGGAFFCRSMNGGPFAWYTQADTTALCSDPSQVGVTTWACAQRSGYCCSLP
ncbi:MAG TPA: hypothetical protein VF334_18065, partial [Polyangia bacterium]